MNQYKIDTKVRNLNNGVCIVDISGEVTGFAENAITDAFSEASNLKAKSIILNFGDMEYMNSSGIGLLVTMLIRCQRQNQDLLAYGLSGHYVQIFELTGLNQAIQVFQSESEALAAVKQ